MSAIVYFAQGAKWPAEGLSEHSEHRADSCQGVYVLSHESPVGSASAGPLLRRVKPLTVTVPQSIADYNATVNVGGASGRRGYHSHQGELDDVVTRQPRFHVRARQGCGAQFGVAALCLMWRRYAVQRRLSQECALLVLHWQSGASPTGDWNWCAN